ncbi:MAG: biopolymer transporter ExbD [Aphanothece sp. CMT-3BRIN-NPC111]|jgi:biopolymer transport protein ExbD|nr:biopolymer transporter ExbD [Aphanothece sp. CMT-3BRIN-NPC111]
MRFKSKHQGSQLPELNLTPMMDVIMTILTFFIVVSMTLSTNPQGVDVTLPSTDNGATEQNTPDPLIVGLNQQGEIWLGNQPVNEAQLGEQMQSYLVQNPKGAVLLKADQKLPYQQVVKVLGKMRDVGGDRVSLAIEKD